MKKLSFALIFLFCVISSYAQSVKSDCYVYGVDFTHAKAFAVDESVEEFAKAFAGINMLLLSEPDKYDFSLLMNRRVHTVIEPIYNLVSSCDYDGLISLNSTCDELDCAEIVKNYELPQTEGTGVVLIAKQLNKPQGKAYYYLVVFDVATREIISEQNVEGNAGGFGLRNYWARTVYNVICRYKAR